VKLLGQFALGWQAVAGVQLTAEDALFDLGSNLLRDFA